MEIGEKNELCARIQLSPWIEMHTSLDSFYCQTIRSYTQHISPVRHPNCFGLCSFVQIYPLSVTQFLTRHDFSIFWPENEERKIKAAQFFGELPYSCVVGARRHQLHHVPHSPTLSIIIIKLLNFHIRRAVIAHVVIPFGTEMPS